MDIEMVTITKSEYDSMQKDCDFLGCLEACGVDNWQGYDEARKMFREGME